MHKLQKDLIYSFTLHSHAYLEITILTEGESVNTINGKEYIMSKGDLVLIPPNTLHSGKSHIGFTDTSVRIDRYTNEDFPYVIHLHDTDGTVLTLSNLIIKTHLEKGPNYTALEESLKESLIQYIKQLSDSSYKYTFTNTLKNIMYTNFPDKNFSLADEIQKLGYNDDYFRRCFKYDTGKSPLEYLTMLRIRQAKDMLSIISSYCNTYICGRVYNSIHFAGN